MAAAGRAAEIDAVRVDGAGRADVVHGVDHVLASGRDVIKELKFVPTRVGISVMLREICVMGAKIDIHRGLPVIHMNFLGYDEQAHRRGPDSAFALWTLKGIDHAIKRIWRDAARAEHRSYDVWIYSDHGQCTATPYQRLTGYTITEAVGRALGQLSPQGVANPPGPHTGSGRAALDYHRDTTQCLCAVRHRSAAVPDPLANEADDGGFRVVGLGPVGFVYFTEPRQTRARIDLARALVAEHPMALELAGIILLMAMLGAVVLARKQIEIGEDEKAERARMIASARGGEA